MCIRDSTIIDEDKIREVIGPGGKVIQRIVAETGCKIDIEDDGKMCIRDSAWAVREGLISGMDDGTLAPQGTATRAQVATILMRLCEKLEG